MVADKNTHPVSESCQSPYGDVANSAVIHEDGSTLQADVVIVGCGAAGLYAALYLPTSMSIIMLSKGAVDECDSMLAQGGICVLPEEGDYETFFADTLAAGHYENRRESVDIMIRSSRSAINDLVALGCDFERDGHGMLAFTREGAHSRPRICYHADTTGREIATTLLAAVRRLPNVRILDHVAMVDILTKEPGCQEERIQGSHEACLGVRAVRVDESRAVLPVDELLGSSDSFEIRAENTLLATGGIGGVYEHSTNFPQLTGDACYIACKHGVALEHLDYVQVHPTGLFSAEPGRTFLISESCRGEGAVLLDHECRRFVDELQPRDVVSAAIGKRMKEEGVPHEWLSFGPVERDVICGHFANIRNRCLEDGRDIVCEPIPVVPTQHYFMGGVHVDRDGATTMPHLYAAGETCCNGVHGKNRLASNSLLEALVFSRRAAYRISTGLSLPVEVAGSPALDGRHRPVSAIPVAIDELCGQDKTVAVGGRLSFGEAPVDINMIGNEVLGQ